VLVTVVVLAAAAAASGAQVKVVTLLAFVPPQAEPHNGERAKIPTYYYGVFVATAIFLACHQEPMRFLQRFVHMNITTTTAAVTITERRQ